jgi:DNA-binding response OmpR family regulator
MVKILLVDDDAEDLELLVEAIIKHAPDAHIQTFTDGPAMLLYLQNCPAKDLPDILVLDYSMPLLNGPQILNKLQGSRYKSIQKFMLTTSAVVRHKSECLLLGVKEYFVKPSTIRELESIVESILSGSMA